ncbi:D-TA family PLP-dependent enzyme [Dactylosporangium darangshiense]|uniref:D-TA family PLP-dependent enzyme n=1 Tax=Dactylosporangium darangshiense TaxID=579108 RepID=A0ABP8D8W8_9ACTN
MFSRDEVQLPGGIATPALVVDLDAFEGNVARMAAAARAGGFALRPHGKTHKSADVAARQLAAGAIGLSVATLGEAEAFARAGVDDLFIAYPLWLDDGKAGRLRLLAETVALRVGVDSAEAARRLGAAVRGSARPVEALVEVDCGCRRTGVQPAAAGAVAAAAAGAGLAVAGVFTFPGHGYGHDPAARERAARDEERALAEAVDALARHGLEARVVSGGSTPTAGQWRPGVVGELRPGVYVFNDAIQLGIGTCGPEDLALAAAATVVSVPAPDRFVLDAGSKVLGADRSPWVDGHGYLPMFPGATVTGLWEHHAVVRLPAGVRGPGLGAVVTVAPNHVCSAVNLVDELLAVRRGAVVERWPVSARGANA